jgi:pyruvate kinase
MLGSLLDAGLNVLRLNFSHGDHAGHWDVLQRYRKVRFRVLTQVWLWHTVQGL